jgi:hypothetical protein
VSARESNPANDGDYITDAPPLPAPAQKPRSRVGRVVRTAKNQPARFEDKAAPGAPPRKRPASAKSGRPAAPAAAPAPPPFDPAPIVEQVGLYWLNGKNYWIPSPSGVWLESTEAHAGKELRAFGVSAQRPEGGGLSQVELALRHVRQGRVLDLVMNLAGLAAGVHDLDGRRILARESPRLITPVAGDFPVIEAMLYGLLGKEQTPRFLAWIKNALECLMERFQRPGLVLILAGSGGSGKNFFQDHFITPLLGGRQGNPSGYLFQSSDFNSELFGCEHLALQDPAGSTRTEERQFFGERLKAIAANELHRCHPKGREAITLAPFWRLSVSLNDDPDKLRILPNLNAPDLKDKVLLLRVLKAAMPMPTDTNQERAAFRAAIVAELPAFVHYLLNVKVDAKHFDSRFGCRAWLNPEIAAMLYDDSPAGRLLELIDLAVLDDDESKDKAWEGGADELEEVLVSPASPIEREAVRFCNHNNVARLLARLAEDMPGRVSKHRTNSRRLWKITPPPMERA